MFRRRFRSGSAAVFSCTPSTYLKIIFFLVLLLFQLTGAKTLWKELLNWHHPVTSVRFRHVHIPVNSELINLKEEKVWLSATFTNYWLIRFSKVFTVIVICWHYHYLKLCCSVHEWTWIHYIQVHYKYANKTISCPLKSTVLRNWNLNYMYG